MIPEDIKSSIDKFKTRLPSDEELTALFDKINEAKLKGSVQEKAYKYLECVMQEAERAQKEASEKDRQRELEAKRERARRIEAERLIAQEKARKEKLVNKTCYWVLSLIFVTSIVFGVVVYFKLSPNDSAIAGAFMPPILGILVEIPITWIVEKILRLAFRLDFDWGMQCMKD